MSCELFLIALIAGRAVAIETGQVDSVVDLGEIVAVPRAGASIRGLTALRSRVITVIDTGRALGLANTPDPARRAIITRVDGHPYAVLVDALEDVASFQRLPLTSGLAIEGGWATVAKGMIERDGKPVLVVDLAALVPNVAAAA